MGSIALISPCIPVITEVEVGEEGELVDADPPPPHETIKKIVKIIKRYFIYSLPKAP